MKNIKKCPFCGNDVAIGVSCKQINCVECCEDCDTITYAIVCDFENGGCGAMGGFRDTCDDAITAWNSRA